MQATNDVPRPVGQYFGGKWRIAPWVIAHLPPHSVYVEPFGGSASVLLRKPVVPVEIYNDLNSDVVNVFRCLRDPDKGARLVDMIRLTPFAREEFEASWAMHRDESLDEVTRAWAWLVVSHQGFKAAATTRRNALPGWSCIFTKGNETDKLHQKTFATFPESLERIVLRLKDLVIEHKDAFELIDQYDRPAPSDILFYVDPPYAGTEYGYMTPFTVDDHARLLQRLLAAKSKVLLSGYETDLYREALQGWTCYKKQAKNMVAQDKVECLWLNPLAQAALDKASSAPSLLRAFSNLSENPTG